MFEVIKKYLRKRALKKSSSPDPTAIVPLSSVRTAVTLIDAGEPGFEACGDAVLAFYREKRIDGELFFFDSRQDGGDGQRPVGEHAGIMSVRDMNWYGKPSEEKMKCLSGSRPDLFMSLVNSTDFPIEYMASSCRARFKIGRRQLPRSVFDMVVSDSPGRESSQLEIFNAVKSLWANISE